MSRLSFCVGKDDFWKAKKLRTSHRFWLGVANLFFFFLDPKNVDCMCNLWLAIIL